MQDNHTRNLKLKEENLELATKLKSLVEQYERREEVGQITTQKVVQTLNSHAYTDLYHCVAILILLHSNSL